MSSRDTYFWKIIHCMQLLSYFMQSSTLLLGFLVFSKWHSTYSKQRNCTMCQKFAYKWLKTIENYKTASPEKWPWPFTGGSGSNCKALTRKVQVCKTCSLLPGGYQPEVVAHGILTVSANSMFWRGGGGIFLRFKGFNKGCLFREATNDTKFKA